MLPPSPLAAERQTPVALRSAAFRTVAAAFAPLVIGVLLTWGSQLLDGLLQLVCSRPVHLPPVGIVPWFGPGWLTVTLMVTVGFGLVPGLLIGLIDRRRPYLSAAIMPAAFCGLVVASFGIAAATGNLPSSGIAIPLVAGLVCPVGAWLSAAAGIALARSALRF